MTVGDHVPYRIAKTLADAEVIRNIRNQGRSWFADEAYISPEQQVSWWNKVSTLPREDFVCHLVGSPPVGYGMLIRREGRRWVSLAVATEARGQGLGTKIYAKLARDSWPKGCHAAIMRDNVASCLSAGAAGYFEEKNPAISPPGISASERWRWIVLRSGP